MEKLKWRIWSVQHYAWWKPEACGYTTVVADAGLYSFTEASEIVESANRDADDKNMPEETMVPVPE